MYGQSLKLEAYSFAIATILNVIQDPNRSDAMNDSQPKTEGYEEIRLMNRSKRLSDSLQESSTSKTEVPSRTQTRSLYLSESGVVLQLMRYHKYNC
jgi:hypothetical protein